jgi:hypothetical protein
MGNTTLCLDNHLHSRNTSGRARDSVIVAGDLNTYSRTHVHTEGDADLLMMS